MTTFARPEQRAAERANIERQLAAWLGNGNTITQVPSGASGFKGGCVNVALNSKQDGALSRRGGNS